MDAATKTYMFEALDEHADPADPMASAHWLADQFSAERLGIITTEEEALVVINDWMQLQVRKSGAAADHALHNMPELV